MKKINYLELMNFETPDLKREVEYVVRAMNGQIFYSDMCKAIVEVHYYIAFVRVNGDTIILESPEEILDLYRDFLKYGAFENKVK